MWLLFVSWRRCTSMHIGHFGHLLARSSSFTAVIRAVFLGHINVVFDIAMLFFSLAYFYLLVQAFPILEAILCDRNWGGIHWFLLPGSLVSQGCLYWLLVLLCNLIDQQQWLCFQALLLLMSFSYYPFGPWTQQMKFAFAMVVWTAISQLLCFVVIPLVVVDSCRAMLICWPVSTVLLLARF